MAGISLNIIVRDILKKLLESTPGGNMPVFLLILEQPGMFQPQGLFILAALSAWNSLLGCQLRQLHLQVLPSKKSPSP